MKLSIVIPVYNVEQYIEKCIKSCLDQNVLLSDYEIIIVNDGSEDKSFEIASNIAIKNKNVTIVSQENLGLSAARNKGVSLAKGDYVWCIDSDDWIDKNCLGNILNNLENLDVLSMGYKIIFENKIKYREIIKDNFISGKALLRSNFIMMAQCYIFNRKFLENNHLHFYEGIFHEDFEFTPRMLYYAQKIKAYDKIVYNQLKRRGSITATNNPKRSEDFLLIANNLLIFSNNLPYNEKVSFYNLIALAINSSLDNIRQVSPYTYDIKNFSYALERCRSLFKIMLKSNKIGYKIEGILFSFFPKHCIRIYSIYKWITNAVHVNNTY